AFNFRSEVIWHALRFMNLITEIVEHAHFIAVLQQGIGYMRTDETRSSRDQNPLHATFLPNCNNAAVKTPNVSLLIMREEELLLRCGCVRYKRWGGFLR